MIPVPIPRGSSPGGLTTQLQFNNAGVLGGISGWTTDGVNAITGGAGTSLALGGATIGANALAVTGTVLFNSATTIAANGAASVPSLLLSGVIMTGGTGTTNFPNFLIQPAGATAATTWSTTGTAFGINLNVAAGNFVDFRTDGTSFFSISNAGATLCAAGSTSVASLRFGSNAADFGFYSSGASAIDVTMGTQQSFGFLSSFGRHFMCYNGNGINFSSNGALGNSEIQYDASGVVALKFGTTAQAQRIYGNTTGNHYLNLQHNGTNAIINVNGGGTLLISSLPTANPGAGILWNNAGNPAIGT